VFVPGEIVDSCDHASAPLAGITFAWDGPAAASAAFHQHRQWTMCDYSLQNVKSRPAQVGDKLETRNFGTGTTGFCDAADRERPRRVQMAVTSPASPVDRSTGPRLSYSPGPPGFSLPGRSLLRGI
jgi:hypothetical protein